MVKVRTAVASIEAGVKGQQGIVERSCTLEADVSKKQELGLGSWSRITRTLTTTDAGTRLEFEKTTQSFNDPDVDVASTARLQVYRSETGAPLFVFETSSQSRAMAPSKTETRTWFEAGVPFLAQHRDGPAFGDFFSEDLVDAPSQPSLDWSGPVRDDAICEGLPALVTKAVNGDAKAVKQLRSSFPNGFEQR